MPCCKSEKYKWCKDLSVVNYKDEEGKEYCVFHAPQGKKGLSVEDFNNLVFERINKAKKEGKNCNLSGTILGDINFRQFDEDNPLPAINFREATFEGEANFKGVKFGEEVSFSTSIFSKKVDFADTSFNKEVYFTNVTFKGEAKFRNAIFSNEINFSSSIFSGVADFVEASFNGKAKFTLIKFERIYFTNTIFNEEAYFYNTKFSEILSFINTKFNKFAQFDGASFIGIVNFKNTIFNRIVFFRRASFDGRINFKGNIFNEGGNCTNLNIESKIKFEEADLKKVSFLDTNLKDIDFINCIWHDKNGRNILYDEISLFSKKKDEDFKNKIKKIEILYQKLKQKYKEEHNETEVSNWHYGEKEMFRRGSRFRRRFPFSLSNLYWLSSGYGERPVRSGIVLLLLIIAISVLFGLTGIKSVDDSNIIEIRQLTDIWDIDYLVATLQYATFETRPDFIPANSFLKIVAKLLIPLQTALFALAVRNRFRR